MSRLTLSVKRVTGVIAGLRGCWLPWVASLSAEVAAVPSSLWLGICSPLVGSGCSAESSGWHRGMRWYRGTGIRGIRDLGFSESLLSVCGMEWPVIVVRRWMDWPVIVVRRWQSSSVPPGCDCGRKPEQRRQQLEDVLEWTLNSHIGVFEQVWHARKVCLSDPLVQHGTLGRRGEGTASQGV